MQEGVEQVKEVITQDIWGSILEFLNFSIISIPINDGTISITVGRILLIIVVFVV